MAILAHGTYLEIAFDDWGVENFIKEIICLCKNETEMTEIESHLIDENVWRGIKLYNIQRQFKNGGKSDQFKQSHSERMKELWSNPEWVKKRKLVSEHKKTERTWDKYHQKKRSVLSTRIYELEEECFQWKKTILMKLLSLTNQDWRTRENDIRQEFVLQGWTIREVEIINSHRQRKEIPICYRSDACLAEWLYEAGFKMVSG